MNTVAAILYAWATSVLLAIFFGFNDGALNSWNAAYALAGGLLLGSFGWWAGRKTARPALRPRGWEWVPIGLFALFALRSFLWLIYYEKDSLCVLAPNNQGDMSLHLTYINYFANGAPFWPDNPVFSQGKLAYAAGIDLFNSLLVLVGVDVVRGLVCVGLIGAGLAGAALWRWGRGFGLLGFLCGGGLLGFAALGQGFDEPFFQDYTDLMHFDWAWKSLPFALLVTQRGFLFALPAGLLLLSSWRARYLGGDEGWQLPRWGAWLLYATMPIFHVHTFIALSFVLAVLFLAHRAARWRVFGFVAAAFVPATALLYLSIGMFQANALPDWIDMRDIDHPPTRPPTEVLGWEPGWMVNEPTPNFDPWGTLAGRHPALEAFSGHGRLLQFWLGNFGFLLLATALVALPLFRQVTGRKISGGQFALGVLGVFLVTPVLGKMWIYQELTLGDLLLGTDDPSLGQCLALVAAGLLVGVAAWLRLVGPTVNRSLGRIFAVFAILFVLAGTFSAAAFLSPQAPTLRINAIPPLVVTAGFLWLLVAIARRREQGDWPAILFFSGLYLFFLCCQVKFAPWAWDNTKVMLWAFLLMLPAFWDQLIARWHWALRSLAVFLLFFSGFINLLGGLNEPRYMPNMQAFAWRSSLDAVRVATKDIPLTEAFAAAPIYNHPLLLIGRKLVLGYPGHVSSHGILCAQQLAELDGLLNGAPEWRIYAARLKVRYLFFGPLEAQQYPQTQARWRHAAQVFAEGEWGAIYDLETPPLPIDPSAP